MVCFLVAGAYIFISVMNRDSIRLGAFRLTSIFEVEEPSAPAVSAMRRTVSPVAPYPRDSEPSRRRARDYSRRPLRSASSSARRRSFSASVSARSRVSDSARRASVSARRSASTRACLLVGAELRLQPGASFGAHALAHLRR